MTVTYTPAQSRYDDTSFFRRCGRSGLKLPAISLGMWHNFGGQDDHDNACRLCFTAFDHGITHFDLANRYGPPHGSAQERTGLIIKQMPRDELVISTKAGYLMWPGPYGEWGSRKYLLASLDQSLKQLQLDYVDIFYHHRPDPDTPLEETMSALDQAVRSGKALYAGISNYDGQRTSDAVSVIEKNNLSPLLIHQACYNMLDRQVEADLLAVTQRRGVGVIAFCPLAQGMLTDKYLNGIPNDSRAASPTSFLSRDRASEPQVITKVKMLNAHAHQRGQTLAQMALAWTLRDPRITSALIGASSPEQIIQNVAALEHSRFTPDELQIIDDLLLKGDGSQ